MLCMDRSCTGAPSSSMRESRLGRRVSAEQSSRLAPDVDCEYMLKKNKGSRTFPSIAHTSKTPVHSGDW
jgi:hypothetical protein